MQQPNQSVLKNKWFENERSKAIQSLKEIFVRQQQQIVEKRKNMNKTHVFLFKNFTRVFIVKNILSYLELDEIINLTALKERTKIEITFDNFVQHAGDDPKTKIASRFSHIQSKKKSISEEDAFARLEAAKNVKDFLTDKLKTTEEKLQVQDRDIKALHKLLDIEKNINQKETMRIRELERELKEERTKHDEKETEILDKVNELETKLREKDRSLQMLSTKYSEIKQHKKVLKNEVLNLMEQLKSSEYRLQTSQTTVNSIADFFNNNTLQKLEQLKERKSKGRKDNEVAS